jgi:thiamine-phosphate pyrophosphorylase
MLRYAITDRTQLGTSEISRRAALLACAARWVREQVDFVQLREKDLPSAALLALCRDLSVVLHAPGSRTRLLVNLANTTAANAIEAGANGAHLPSSALEETLDAAPGAARPSQLRQLFASSAPSASASQSPILSISCHTLEQVQAAARDGVDLILIGPVFGKTIPTAGGGSRTVTPAVGIDALQAACVAAAGIPVLALGGITRENAPACLRAGAAGIAAIRLFQSTE